MLSEEEKLRKQLFGSDFETWLQEVDASSDEVKQLQASMNKLAMNSEKLREYKEKSLLIEAYRVYKIQEDSEKRRKDVREARDVVADVKRSMDSFISEVHTNMNSIINGLAEVSRMMEERVVADVEARVLEREALTKLIAKL